MNNASRNPKTYKIGGLPEHLDMSVKAYGDDWIELEMPIGEKHLRPGVPGLHAGSVVSLADTACGFGCKAALPEGANGYITMELKSNLIATAKNGTLIARAKADHKGRTTQIWSAEVTHLETGRTLNLFRCTQLILWP